MILFLIGLIIGSVAGMMLMAMLVASKKEDTLRSI